LGAKDVLGRFSQGTVTTEKVRRKDAVRKNCFHPTRLLLFVPVCERGAGVPVVFPLAKIGGEFFVTKEKRRC
jgi:hypothetical protein